MNLRQEQKLWKSGYRLVAGVDEVGRGALAGPVAAGAVLILPNAVTWKLSFHLEANLPSIKKLLKIKDSKHLSPIQREKYYQLLTNHSGIVWSVATVSQKTIDRIGIDKAVWRAMEKAVLKLEKKPNFLLIDGNRFSSRKLKPKTYNLIVRGDEKIFSIAAASVIAKVTRDRLMARLAKKYPHYGLEKNKGYGTKAHFRAIEKRGISKIHRRSFLAGMNKP